MQKDSKKIDLAGFVLGKKIAQKIVHYKKCGNPYPTAIRNSFLSVAIEKQSGFYLDDEIINYILDIVVLDINKKCRRQLKYRLKHYCENIIALFNEHCVILKERFGNYDKNRLCGVIG